jgi:hypothetical protein
MNPTGSSGVVGDRAGGRIVAVAWHRRSVASMFAALLVILLGAALSGSAPPAPPSGAEPGSGQSGVPGATPPIAGGFAERTITIVGGGDVLLHPSVWARAAADAKAAGQPGYDFQPLFTQITPDVRAADLAICHLETPVGPPGGPFSGYPVFSVPPQITTALRGVGFDTCTTASNHTLDGGERGVYRTLDALDAAGLRHAGSHRSAAEQARPTIIDVRGVKVTSLSYASGFNGLLRPPGKEWLANRIDPAAILAEARRARSGGADIVVVSLHWGEEYDHAASTVQVSLARQLLAGPEIDLILGCHAHVVQPIERINGRWVVYGMGNLIARQSDAYPARHEGIMPRLTFTELAPGRWTATRLETVATWIETTPRIRIVNLADAIADPATPPDRRVVYLAAMRRIMGYVQARGATPAGDAHDERWEDG